MSKATPMNLLADPEIQRHTRRILALQEEERQTREELGRIVAEIGAELIAAKQALDKTPDKTAWQRWLKDHVHYSAETAQNYMSVARFAKKTETFPVFLGLEPSVLYRLAALPDELAATLTPDTLLTDPGTGRKAALKEMSARSLDRALDALEGKAVPKKPKQPRAFVPSAQRLGTTAGRSVGVAVTGATREEFAADAQLVMGTLSDQLAEIRKLKGTLTGNSKERVLESIERLRRIVLKWPAWATPATRKKSTR